MRRSRIVGEAEPPLGHDMSCLQKDGAAQPRAFSITRERRRRNHRHE